MIGFGKTSKGSGRRKSFVAAAAAVPDPLAKVEYSGNVEADSAAELGALEEAFRGRKSQEDERFQLATDSEYWVALCFPSRKVKDAFLRAAKTARLGDKYVDGLQFARALGIEVREDGTENA